jgi:hypothetical protein
VFLSKFRCRTILMHFLLPICGKFTRAQLAHQIFLILLRHSDWENKIPQVVLQKTPGMGLRSQTCQMPIKTLHSSECDKIYFNV